MRRFVAAASALLLLLAFPLPVLADPGAGVWTGDDCRAAWMTGRYHTCQYEFTDTTDSALLVVANGPWEFCFDPNLAADAVGTGTVSLRKVNGDSDTTNESFVVNGLVLTGATGLVCIYNLGAGRYWADVIGDPGAADAMVTFRHM